MISLFYCCTDALVHHCFLNFACKVHTEFTLQAGANRCKYLVNQFFFKWEIKGKVLKIILLDLCLFFLCTIWVELKKKKKKTILIKLDVFRGNLSSGTLKLEKELQLNTLSKDWVLMLFKLCFCAAFFPNEYLMF